MILRLVCCMTIVAIISIDTIAADLSTRDRIRIHREWLERRAAKRSNVSAPNSPPDSLVATTQRTTYMRKLIKFKNENEPLSENDILFVPHFGNGAEVDGGSNGHEGVNNGSGTDTAPPTSGKQQDRLHHQHHQHDQQRWNFHPHRVHAASHNEKEILTDDAERYRYDVVSTQDVNRQEIEASGRMDSLSAAQLPHPHRRDPKPLVYIMAPSVSSPEEPQDVRVPVTGLRAGEFPATTVASIVEEQAQKINVAVGSSNRTLAQSLSVGDGHNTTAENPLNNDLSSGLVVAATNVATTDRKSDRIPLTRDAAEGALLSGTAEPNGVVRSSEASSGGVENGVMITTTTVTTEENLTGNADHEQNLTLQLESGPPSANVSVRNLFGPWSNWTACSRSCGGGVKTQFRSCWKREYINGKKSSKPAVESFECIGIIKRYHLCNEQDCPTTDGDFREQQCASFNSQTFQDKRYIWEAFVKEDAECELNCKPIGMRYFATLNKTVIDGTPCSKPTEYFRRNNSGRGICVEGLCKAVHNSGVISGTFMNNGAVRCGTTVCRPISGIYTKTNPNNGYVHVATIPAGASNITITELQNSQNYLALKTADQRFFINGDYTISLSGHYIAAGTVFDYRRVDGLNNGSNSSFRHVEGITEWVTALGPTNEPVQMFLLSQSPNPGIKYEYLLPVSVSPTEPSSLEEVPSAEAGNEISEKSNLRVPKQRVMSSSNNNNNTGTIPGTGRVGQRKRKYLWKVIGFSACSKSCGGGIQQPIIKCVRESPTRVFSAKRCAHLQQPVLNENLLRCNTQPCPAYWKLGDWDQCNCEEKYDEEVFRTREVKCVQELLSGIVIQVNNGACMDELPPSTERCECSRVVKPTPPRTEKPRYRPTESQHQHEHRGHRGHQHQQHHDHHNAQSGHSHTQNDAENGPLANGGGFAVPHSRQRTDINHINYRAEAKKTGVWLTANWSTRCSTTCGIGMQTRSIFCDRSSSINSERCDLRMMPETSRECTSNRACEFGEWFAGPWTLCSGDCFNLTRSRTVLCIRNDHFAPESECDADLRPSSIEPCDTESFEECKPRWHFSEWSECTKPCGGGNQRRVVKCLEFNLRDKLLQESGGCRYADRPTSYRVCNEESCPVSTAPPATSTTTRTTTSYTTTLPTSSSSVDPYYEARSDMMSNDENCRDDFPNCTIVVKAKLCNYAYYSQACCQMCRTRQNELY
ncbi:thrombospondin type-1 domain-containing protein 4 [Anopheles gambiae]|uniref:thrombospondin type-1 domain-containing protein 4 n=1 Tax=Anopheles gambiae TaxID=7165 RepID=UPI002AC8FD09|nr:thrombospondin type-1 domain-containing protein 4 [Anopheles gambiae]XP_061511352.1 thrombospondin type-1 domain-containing protein 4 [Anopheles gambiae]